MRPLRPASLVFAVLWLGCGGAQREVDKSATRVDLATDLYRQGQDVAAETEILKAIEYDPANERAHDLLGLVYVFRAQRNVRLIEFDDCLDDSVAAGLRQEASQHMRTADGHFHRATDLAPDFGDAWQNRAVVAMYFQDWDRAAEYEHKAIGHLARLESEPLARANLGWAYHQKRDDIRAAGELLQAAQRDPRLCLASYRLAEVLFQRGEYADALRRLAGFRSEPPACPGLQQADYLAGETLQRMHDLAGSAKAFESCVRLAPRSCQARQCDRSLKEQVSGAR